MLRSVYVEQCITMNWYQKKKLCGSGLNSVSGSRSRVLRTKKCKILQLKKKLILIWPEIATYNVQATREAPSLQHIQHLKHEICSVFSISVGNFLPFDPDPHPQCGICGSASNRPKSTRIRIHNIGWNTEQSGTDPWQWCPAGLACRSPRSIDLIVGGRAVRLQHRVLTPPPL